jgi:PAS domain S-box-containing protein
VTGEGGRILLVEDEPTHAELIQLAFERSGYGFEVRHASSLKEAKRLLAEDPPDLVLTDWLLPDGRGLDLLERVTSMGERPFLIMTSHGSEQVAVEALKAGAHDYIVKSPEIFAQMPHMARRALREWGHIRQRRLAEARYGEFVQNAPMGVISTTLEGVILTANPALARMYGYASVEEGVASVADVFSHYKATDQRAAFLREIARAGVVRDYEMLHHRRDGSDIWVSCSARLVRDENGRPKSIECFLQDITARKQAELKVQSYREELEREVLLRTAELEESRQRLSDIIEFLPDATFVLDADGRVKAWNQAMAELTGVPKERVLGKGNHEYSLHLYGARKPALVDLVLSGKSAHMGGALREGEHALVVETYLDALQGGNGSFVSIKASPLLDKDGNVVGAVESVRDITARKRAERTLKEQLEFIQALVDGIPSPMVYRDNEDRFLLCNRAFEVHSGLDREEIIGSGPRDVFSGSMLEKVLETDKLLAERDHVVYEARVESHRGKTTDIMVRKAVHRDADGRRLGVVSVFMDISERKRMEREIRAAKEAAEAASKAKSSFLATMSHEIRTPLNAVMGMTEITLQSELSPGQRQNVQAVMDSARHLLDVINDILDFSKIEAGRLELEELDFHLGETLSPLQRTFSAQAAEKGVAFQLELDPGLPPVLRGDPFRLRQVLFNLVGNAIKFTERGRVCLEVRRASEGSGAGPGVSFRVADTGIGIPGDKLCGIFESFSQVDSATNRRYGGTGLGLSISQRLVAMMGGRLDVESRQGEGSVFRFTLALPEGDAGALAQPEEEASSVGPLKVLVVEDNPLNMSVALQHLERMGHRASPAGNGREALGLLAREPFDLVLMDLEMPEMDGLEAVRRLRAGEAGAAASALPVLAMTAHAVCEVRDECLAAGMTAFLTKPAEYKVLRRTVENVMCGWSARDCRRERGLERGLERRPDQERAGGVSSELRGGATPGQKGPAPVLDWRAFLEDLGGRRPLLDGFYGEFLTNLAAGLVRLREAMEARDHAALAGAAHALKGSSATARAARLSALARNLEQGARGGRPMDELRALLPAMEAEAEAVRRAMAAIPPEPAAP